MKKLLLLFLVLTGMVSTASAEGLTIYLNTGGASLWSGDGAKFAVWNHSTSTFIKFTALGGNYYKADLPDGYTNINLFRYDPSKEPAWDNSSKWNQTNDITPSTDVNCFTITGWEESSYSTSKIYEDLTLEGSRHITNGYKEWEADAANKATMAAGVNTLLVSGKALKAGTYEYKYYTGSEWIPAGDNLSVAIAEDGVYDLTFTFNQFTDTKSCDAEKKSSDPVEYRYYIFEGDGNPITGKEWTENLMTVDEGKATLTVNNVALAKGTEYKFKIVEEVYLNSVYVEDSRYWSFNPGSGNMWSLTPSQATTCNVTFTYNIPTNFTYKEDNVFFNLTPLAGSWYFIVGEGGNWTIGDKLTETSSGVFTGTLIDWNGKYFAIAPSAAITGTSTIDWTKVIRPTGTEDKWLSFPWIYTDQSSVTNNENSLVWALYINAAGGSLDFTYNSNTEKWDAIPYIPLTISNGYATFSYPHNDSWGQIAIPDGITAYYATAAAAGSVTMTAIAGGKFPENEPVFLKAESTTEEYKFYAATSEEYTDPVTNLLVKGTAAGVAASTAGSFNYVYAKQGGNTGFYNVATAIPTDMTGKAYLHTTTDIKPAGAHVAIIFDDETTGIKQVETAKQNVEGYFNLAGQRVAQPTKGLYIVNGKKVLLP